jgi:two-component system, cell cycle response regulator DivK
MRLYELQRLLGVTDKIGTKAQQHDLYLLMATAYPVTRVNPCGLRCMLERHRNHIDMPRILLIEDIDANRDLISRYLGLFDYDVVTASDGQAGLTKAQLDRSEIDLVLLDMNLPLMDGWEVARQLKENESTRSLPVIAVTAHAMVGDREKGLSAGCDEYITKPIDFTALLEKIESLLCKEFST